MLRYSYMIKTRKREIPTPSFVKSLQTSQRRREDVDDGVSDKSTACRAAILLNPVFGSIYGGNALFELHRHETQIFLLVVGVESGAGFGIAAFCLIVERLFGIGKMFGSSLLSLSLLLLLLLLLLSNWN